MSDLKIEDATPDTSVTGTEKLPVSDAGMAKCMTTEQIKDFVMDRIAALAKASAIDMSANAVYIEREGSQMRMDANAFCDAVIGFTFGKSVSTSLNGNEYFSIKNGSLVQTVSLTQLRDWLKGNLGNTQIAALDTANALADSNFMAVSQTGIDKKATLALVRAFCLAGLFAYADENEDTITDEDYILCFKSGMLSKVTLENSGFAKGDVIAPNNQTDGAIPAWDTAEKRLTSGYEVTDTISESTGGVARIPTEAAVRAACNARGDVTASGTPVAGAIPSWGTGKSLTAGSAIVTALGDTPTDSQIPTAKAVKTAVDAVKCPPVINDLTEAQATNDNIPSSLAALTAIENAISDNVPENCGSRLIDLEARRAVLLDGVQPYATALNLSLAGGVFAIKSAYFARSGSSIGKYLYVNTGSEYSPSWKVVCKLDQDYPIA